MKRLASLEKELRAHCEELKKLQEAIERDRRQALKELSDEVERLRQNGSDDEARKLYLTWRGTHFSHEPFDRILNAILQATFTLIHTCSRGSTVQQPGEFSVHQLFADLAPSSPQAADMLDKASTILVRIAAIMNAIVQEHQRRFTSGMRRRSSFLPQAPAEPQQEPPRRASVRPLRAKK